jgi:hypothetical protein
MTFPNNCNSVIGLNSNYCLFKAGFIAATAAAGAAAQVEMHFLTDKKKKKKKKTS